MNEFNFDNWPRELKQLQQYVCWKREATETGKITKVLKTPTLGGNASTTDSNKWRSFDVAVNEYVKGLKKNRFDGVGFVLKKDGGLVGIDLDGCIKDDGELSELAKDVLATVDSYTEVSPSGRGLHIICRADVKRFADGTGAATDKARHIEIYLGPQYFTVTGNVFRDRRTLNKQTEVLLQLVEKYFPEKLVQHSQDAPALPQAASVSMSDDEVLARIRRSDQATKFSRLHDEGDYSGYLNDKGLPDHSRGDMAEIEIICYWTQDPEQVYRIFSASALARSEKGIDKRKKYLMDTIRKAITRVLTRGTVYNPQDYFRKKTLAALTAAADLDQLKELFFYELTDAGRADRVRAVAGDAWLYSSNARSWYQWTGQRWLENAGSGLSELMIRIYRQLQQLIGAGEITFSGSGRDQDKQREAYMRFYKDSCNLPKIRAARALLADFLDVDSTNGGPVFDCSVSLLNTPAGTLDLGTGETYAHRKGDYITKITASSASTTYAGSLWEKTINEVIPDAGTREYFQRFLGYCLTGDTSEEKFLIAYGKGGQGKGTLLETVAAAMGDYAAPVPIEMLLQGRTSTGEAPAAQLLSLKGRRLALCSESGIERRLDAAKVKWLTGGDTITARGLYAKKPVTWKPSHKIVIQSNYLPEIPDAMDSGIRRRLVIVPFNASGIITDPALKSKLQEPGELRHVLCWLLEGHRKWRQDGLGSESREMEEIRTRYYADNDPLSQWLEERCIEGPGYELLLKDGLIDFNSWLAGKAVNRKRFIDDMLAHGFKKKRTRAGTAFDGLQLFDIFN